MPDSIGILKNKIYSPVQAGFRINHSTDQQIAKLSQYIKDSMDEQETTLAVFVDFKDAYGSVWRPKVMEKLHNLGIHGKMFRWIYSFINQRFCCTKYGDSISKYKQSKKGLPQGSIISPTLFNILINDLPADLQKSNNKVKCALYADDLVIWTSLPHMQQNQLSSIMNKTLNLSSKLV